MWIIDAIVASDLYSELIGYVLFALFIAGIFAYDWLMKRFGR